MGSDETAITIPGALEKLTFFTGTGRHRDQIIYFFRMQIGPRTRSPIGLGSGSRRHRMRRFLGLPRELWIEKLADLCSRPIWLRTCTDMYLSMEAPAHAV